MTLEHDITYKKVPMRNLCHYIVKRAENAHFRLQESLLKERFATSKYYYRRDLKAHFGCVNAIEFSLDGKLLCSGGDDRRVLIWNMEKALCGICVPDVMEAEHNSNIFCLAINKSATKVFSGGNDEQVVVHDIEKKSVVDVFLHSEAVYGLSSDPCDDNIFASACDDGRALVYDIRQSSATDPLVLAACPCSMHCVTFNPVEHRVLATANAKEGLALWDIRVPQKCLLHYGGTLPQQSCMSASFNHFGTQLLTLRRRLPPVLYDISNANPLCDLDHDGYYNSCTMKSCCFAGPNDEFVLSGSDDFNLYMWKIPDDLSQRVFVKRAHVILHGHRSIVNQVRYNYDNNVIVSSGVEKVIKVWSPFPFVNVGKTVEESDTVNDERLVFTHEEYINLVLRSGLLVSHDYSLQSLDEDPRMMAFFDSLVQREVENLSSEDDTSSNETELYNSVLQSLRSHENHTENSNDTNGSIHADDSGSDSLDNNDLSPFTRAFSNAMVTQNTGASDVLNAHDESESANQAILCANQSLRRKTISQIITQNRKGLMHDHWYRKLNFHTEQRTISNENTWSSVSSDSEHDNDMSRDALHDFKKDLEKRRVNHEYMARKVKRLALLRFQLLNGETGSHTTNSSSCITPSCDELPAFSSLESENSCYKTDNFSSTSCNLDDAGQTSLITDITACQNDAFLEKNSGTDFAEDSGHLFVNHSQNVSSVASNHPSTSHLANQFSQASNHSSYKTDSTNGKFVSTNQRSDNCVDEKPVWKKFCRFKKTVEKAARRYRQRDKQINDSSDDD